MRTFLNRRWLSFNLRTALLLFTVATIGFWVYWDGWQRWKWYLDQRTFIHSASQLRAGSHVSVQRPLLAEDGFYPWYAETGIDNEDGNSKVWQSYRWPNAIYVVYWQYHDWYCTSVEVYQLPDAPADYRPKSDLARRISRMIAGAGQDKYRKAYPATIGYTNDFFQMIQGDRKDSPQFDYELIHSDFSKKAADSSRD